MQGPIHYQLPPRVDVSPELDTVGSAYCASLIGILRWIVELGRVDIGCEVSIMSSHMTLPRQGHLQQLYHMFGYLKIHHNAEIVFDSSDPDIDMSKFERQDWSGTVYQNFLKEESPPNMPTPRGQSMKMTCFVDSNHADDSVTRRSRTGFIVYLQSAPNFRCQRNKQASKLVRLVLNS